jgi:heme A synthase
MTGFQRLSLTTCVVVFGLIILGGVVRATDSGLGCSDWPHCNGSFIPEFKTKVLIEYSHRTVATIAGFLVLAVAIGAWRSYRKVPTIVIPAFASLGLLIIQAGLGGVTVLSELPPGVVTVHLGTALVLLTMLIITTTAAFAHQRPLTAPRVTVNLSRFALLAWANVFAIMLVGAYMAGSDYGLACNGWPLCNGDVIPSSGATSIEINFMHRFLALTLGIFVVLLATTAWRRRAIAPLIANLAVAALVVYGAQVLIGAANIWTTLSNGASTAHLAVGTLLWVTLGVMNIRIHRLHELLRPRPAEAPDRGMPGLVR